MVPILLRGFFCPAPAEENILVSCLTGISLHVHCSDRDRDLRSLSAMKHTDRPDLPGQTPDFLAGPAVQQFRSNSGDPCSGPVSFHCNRFPSFSQGMCFHFSLNCIFTFHRLEQLTGGSGDSLDLFGRSVWTWENNMSSLL